MQIEAANFVLASVTVAVSILKSKHTIRLKDDIFHKHTYCSILIAWKLNGAIIRAIQYQAREKQYAEPSEYKGKRFALKNLK